MINKLLFQLVKLFYKGHSKASILFLLSGNTLSKEEIVAKIDSMYIACHNGYYMYVNDPDKTEELIDFFSSEAEALDDFTRFLESFNSDFNSEVSIVTKEAFNEIKNHLVYFTPQQTSEVLDTFFTYKAKLNKAMSKMLNSRILALDEKITVRSYIKTVSGEHSLGSVLPDDDKWN